MSRRMSCSLKTEAIKDRSSTETRRIVDAWKDLKPGDRLTLIEKGRGLPKGAHQVVLAEVEVVAVNVEPVAAITLAGVAAEGFGPGSHLGGRGGWTVNDFVTFWLGSHGYGRLHPDIARNVLCRRIEWRYVV